VGVDQASRPVFVQLVHFLELLSMERLLSIGGLKLLDASAKFVGEGVSALTHPAFAHQGLFLVYHRPA
jgi:hypothetical protein